MDKPVLIFDYDGTIHETMRIYAPAMRSAFSWLAGEHGINLPEISDSEIASWLGINSIDTWDLILPGLPDEIKSQASSHVADHMARLVYSGAAKWYDGIRDQLVYLKSKEYTMVILSNCRTSYKDAHWTAFHMSGLFDRFYDCESFGYIPKEDIFPYISKEFPGRYIVIGDRRGDITCAVKNGLASIGCLYGYGSPDELVSAGILVDSPSGISDAVRELL